jgi:hypothetical protein
MDILNFISWIRGGRKVTIVDPAKTLLPVGLKDGRRDDEYLAGAISVADLATNLVSDRLVAGTSEVVLTDNAGDAELTFSTGDVTIQTTGAGADLFIRTLGGDDIFIESGDDITLRGDQGLFDDEAEGGDINIYAGDGSDGNAANAGDGGDVRIYAGDAGNSVSGNQSTGGTVTIRGGYTSLSATSGAEVYVYGGNSTDGIEGNVYIGNINNFTFNPNQLTLTYPIATLADLGLASLSGGARAIINDSTAFASGNFGVQAVGGGANIVPVFSDGTNWVIG